MNYLLNIIKLLIKKRPMLYKLTKKGLFYFNLKNHLKYIFTRVVIYKYLPGIFLFFKFGSSRNINTAEYWDGVHAIEKERSRNRFGGIAYSILSRNVDFKDKSVLDVGSGVGDFLFSIEDDCNRFGIDISNEAIDYLNERGILAKRCVLPTVAFKENFDIITCFETLEHIKPWQDTIRELIRHLKPQGYLIVSVPLENRIIDREHVNYFDVSRLYGFLKDKVSVLEIKFMGPRFLVVAQNCEYDPHSNSKIPKYHFTGCKN